MTKKQPRSIAWQFFEKVEQNGKCNKVLCNLCCKEYKFIGNTTNMRSHLSKKHPIQWGLINNEPINESLLSHKGTKSRKRKYSTNSVQNDNDDDTNATINLIRQMHDVNNEEWIEETEVIEEDYEPENNIKRVSQFKRKSNSPQVLEAYTNYNRISEGNSIRVKDEFSMFGEYIANKLRNINNLHTQGNVQQIITTLMWQAEQGHYDTQESVTKMLFHILLENNSSQDLHRDISVPCAEIINNIN